MNKDLDIAKVYDYVTSNQMGKTEAIEMLNYFLEESDNNEIRKISLLAFKILENPFVLIKKQRCHAA